MKITRNIIVCFLILACALPGKAIDPLLTALSGNISMVVAQDGSGNYTKLQDAINACPANSGNQTVIYIKNGIYKEKISVVSTRKNLTLIGQDVDSTIITFDDNAGKGGNNRSFNISSDNFTACNLTIENSYGVGSQAIALGTLGDRAQFLHVRLVGYQDTYYSDSYKHAYFKDCLIIGCVDYIYGKTTVVFDSCQIHNLRSGSYITAANTEQANKFGYVFLNSWISNAYGSTGVYLGRPWRQYANVGFINCYMGEGFHPAGWHNWGNPANEPTVKFYEYNGYGPGSDIRQRVSWSHQLTADSAAQYTLANIYSSANNPTRIPNNWLPTVDSDSVAKIVKNHITPFLNPAITSSKLTGLKYEGGEVTDFDPEVSELTIQLPSGTQKVPQLYPVPESNSAKIEICYPSEEVNYAIIKVAAKYEASYSVYKIYFQSDGKILTNKRKYKSSNITYIDLSIAKETAQYPVSNQGIKTGQVKAFPNPNTGLLHVDLSRLGQKAGNMIIYNLNGQPVQTEEIKPYSNQETQQIDISGLTKGVYVLNVCSNSGRHSVMILKK